MINGFLCYSPYLPLRFYNRVYQGQMDIAPTLADINGLICQILPYQSVYVRHVMFEIIPSISCPYSIGIARF